MLRRTRQPIAEALKSQHGGRKLYLMSSRSSSDQHDHMRDATLPGHPRTPPQDGEGERASAMMSLVGLRREVTKTR
ncbi:hypothetical protein E2C01_083299 [Portunus trituberculatus]|uniref:Uncharacterized protein n=1 Tax=Portunus trituberculatus TaxID=210409 RepID=A0A5B7J345_PORTR|nr:hypothetical protein [Portunus trituberculatus]